MSFYKAIAFVIFVLLCKDQTAFAQTDSIFQKISIIDTAEKLLSLPVPKFLNHKYSKSEIDSITRSKISGLFSKPNAGKLKRELLNTLQLPSFKKNKPLVQINDGYISYNWNFRSGIDTPFIEKNISQHLVSANINATVAGIVPFRISYFERKSNSEIFRDFRDIRVEMNTHEFQRLLTDKFRSRLSSLPEKFQDPFTKTGMDISQKKITDFNSWLNYSVVKKKLIDAKEKLLFPDVIDAETEAKRDSVIKEAKSFIELYEKMEFQRKKYERIYDSLYNVYVTAEKVVSKFRQLINGNLGNPENIHAIKEMARKYGVEDKRLMKLTSTVSSIRTFAIGRTMPNFSNLTLKNTNVRGLNFEYNRNNIYFGVAAGSVDFRVRDFVFNRQRRVPQHVYSVRAGYGEKERNNIILTYFEGKKQIYSGLTSNHSQNIKGISVATQLLVSKHTRINAEIAHSASPSLVNANGNSQKSVLDFRDKNNQAFSLQIKSNIQATKTKLEAQYQHTGVNFQSFTNYRVNASANSWYAKAEQYVWKKNIHLVAVLRKNDFTNPLILQRYNANTIFKNFTATVRKRNWPVLSVGYMPSSQFAVIDSVVYENRYQILNATISHQYKLGTARASSAFMYNRFYNDIQDTGFVYYNANNFFFNQTIHFTYFTSNLSISHTENGLYALDVWDAGFLFKVLKQNIIGFGVKINHLDTYNNSKVGLYGNARVAIPKVGELNVWLEKNYLPDLHQQLVKNEFYNIGFTRYFK